jgi:hypothetical protein
MFIENYRDNITEMIPAGGETSSIPYPKLSDEDWEVWRRFLPYRSRHFNREEALNNSTRLRVSYGMPYQVTREIHKASEYFDEIEVWGKHEVYKDPIAVGLYGGERYLIARWGMDKLVPFETIKKGMKNMPPILAWKYSSAALGILACLAVAWGFLS